MVQAIQVAPSENFATNLHKVLQRKNTPITEKINFVLDYIIHRFVNAPLRVAWICFLLLATFALPVCYFDYLESYSQNQPQALPLWKMPAEISINK